MRKNGPYTQKMADCKRPKISFFWNFEQICSKFKKFEQFSFFRKSNFISLNESLILFWPNLRRPQRMCSNIDLYTKPFLTKFYLYSGHRWTLISRPLVRHDSGEICTSCFLGLLQCGFLFVYISTSLPVTDKQAQWGVRSRGECWEPPGRARNFEGAMEVFGGAKIVAGAVGHCEAPKGRALAGGLGSCPRKFWKIGALLASECIPGPQSESTSIPTWTLLKTLTP